MEIGPDHIAAGGIAYLTVRNLYHILEGYKKGMRDNNHNNVSLEADNALELLFGRESLNSFGETAANTLRPAHQDVAADRFEPVPNSESIEENTEYVRSNLESEIGVVNHRLYHGYEL